MPTIGAAVDAAIKARFEAEAKRREVTTSRLAASLIVAFLAQDDSQGQAPNRHLEQDDAQTAPARASKTEQVFVRLAPYYFSELGRLAQERCWYRSTYLANLLQAHVDRRPVLCDAEVNALRQVARQLADMGRNLNQIAKRLNSSLHHESAENLDFELIKLLLEIEANSIRALMKANLHGWGVDDVEA